MNPSRWAVRVVKETVADRFGLLPEELSTRSRLCRYVWPRQIAIYLVRRATELSELEIAEEFGLKSPSTVQHCVRTVEDEMSISAPVKGMIGSYLYEALRAIRAKADLAEVLQS